MTHGQRRNRQPAWDLDSAQAAAYCLLLAAFVLVSGGCASSQYVTKRSTPLNSLNSLALQLNMASSTPDPTERTARLLRRYDLVETQAKDPDRALDLLEAEIRSEPDIDKMHAYGELAFIEGQRALAGKDQDLALEMFGDATAHAYMYLFDPRFDRERNHYDPQFRQVCDLYNLALESLLRIINNQGRLRPGESYPIDSDRHRLDLQISLRGPWNQDDFEKFEFVSDYQVSGRLTRHVTYGLGVPLIAVYREGSCRQEPAAEFYPADMAFPVTAILRAHQRPCTQPEQHRSVLCSMELHDALGADRVEIADRCVPLETDLTTPLGFFLDHRQFKGSDVAWEGLTDPDAADKLRGLYMLEAYDPYKIPVLMVHGLWSSPETWTEMINELRSLPEIRNRYQFWTYLYPTGQPFWISATRLREDLHMVRQAIDPQRRSAALDQMVVMGHSMGGLVARLQTLESGDDYWHLLSQRPFEDLQTDPETRARLVQTLFFQPNDSIRRVITMGTPHRGSTFANDYTRWLGRKLIKLPTMLVQTRQRVIEENPDFFTNTQVLTINTSIDSLSPDCPVLPVMLRSKSPPWVAYHNVVGVVSKRDLLGRISESGDGVVSFDSAHLDDVESEIVVEADHVSIHQHPRTILEVRRILLKHSAQMYAERQQTPTTLPAGYQANVSYANPSYANPQYANPQYANPQYANPSYANPSYANPSYANPSYANPQYANPAYPHPTCADPVMGPLPSTAEHPDGVLLR